MANAAARPVYKGVFPVAPTVFDEAGRLDPTGSAAPSTS